MGPEFGSELEIPKKIILAIEELGAARLPVLFAPFGNPKRLAPQQLASAEKCLPGGTSLWRWAGPA
jgi:hypothetical protein